MLNGWEEIIEILEGEVGVNCFSIFDFGIFQVTGPLFHQRIGISILCCISFSLLELPQFRMMCSISKVRCQFLGTFQTISRHTN